MPATLSLIQFSFNLDECNDEEALSELMTLVFHIIEKVGFFLFFNEGPTDFSSLVFHYLHCL